jgi:hypothetical protein
VSSLEYQRLGYRRHIAHAGAKFTTEFMQCAQFLHQLRSRLEKIKHDDVMIAKVPFPERDSEPRICSNCFGLKETVEALSTMELRAACSERGCTPHHRHIPATGI